MQYADIKGGMIQTDQSPEKTRACHRDKKGDRVCCPLAAISHVFHSIGQDADSTSNPFRKITSAALSTRIESVLDVLDVLFASPL